jgi:hypothetical protein
VQEKAQQELAAAEARTAEQLSSVKSQLMSELTKGLEGQRQKQERQAVESEAKLRRALESQLEQLQTKMDDLQHAAAADGGGGGGGGTGARPRCIRVPNACAPLIVRRRRAGAGGASDPSNVLLLLLLLLPVRGWCGLVRQGERTRCAAWLGSRLPTMFRAPPMAQLIPAKPSPRLAPTRQRHHRGYRRVEMPMSAGRGQGEAAPSLARPSQ